MWFFFSDDIKKRLLKILVKFHLIYNLFCLAVCYEVLEIRMKGFFDFKFCLYSILMNIGYLLYYLYFLPFAWLFFLLLYIISKSFATFRYCHPFLEVKKWFCFKDHNMLLNKIMKILELVDLTICPLMSFIWHFSFFLRLL